MQVEQLEREVAELQQALSDKTQQENAMILVMQQFHMNFISTRIRFCIMITQFCIIISNILQVLMRVEQEQKVTEDARILAEQDAAAQRYAVEVLQVSFCSVSA